MNPQSLAELQALRIRAYGPAPDIHIDDEALRRLDELESLARAASTAEAATNTGGNSADPKRVATSDDVQEPPDIDGATPVGDDALPVTSHVPSSPSVASAPPAESTASTAECTGPAESAVRAKGIRRKARRRTALWIVALIATAGLAAVIAHELSTVPVVTRDHDAVQVATLRVDPSFEWPEFFPSDESTGYEDYFGLTAVAFSGDMWPGSDGECLAVLRTTDVKPGSSSISGMYNTGCNAGDFPAAVQFAVGDDMPEALRERFPTGSALQFVMIDGRVAVFSDAE